MQILLKDLLKETTQVSGYYKNKQSMSETLEEKSTRKIQIYLDMDGVLVNMEKGFEKISGGFTPKNFYKSKIFDEFTDETARKKAAKRKFWKLIDATPNFWLNLEPMADAQPLWDFIKNNFKAPAHPTPVILSAGEGKSIEAQKKEWIRKFGIDASVLVKLAPSGDLKAGSTLNIEGDVSHYLIDDTGPGDVDTADKKQDNITAWNKVPNHFGIHHESGKKTIDTLSAILLKNTQATKQ